MMPRSAVFSLKAVVKNGSFFSLRPASAWSQPRTKEKFPARSRLESAPDKGEISHRPLPDMVELLKHKKVEYKPVEYPPTSEILQSIEETESQIQKEFAALKGLLIE